MKSRFPGCLFAFISFFLVISLLFNAGLLIFILEFNSEQGVHKETVYDEELIEGSLKSKDKIAVIDLYGIITSSSETGDFASSMVDELTLKLKQAREDDAVKAIILRIDSPGGEVNASDLIYHEIKKTRAVKPVIVYMGSVAASGGFYAAMGSSYIIANDLTITGSIGVILQSINYKDLIGKIGVKAVTFKSGKFKDLLNGARDITPEEQALVQQMIDDTYNKFVGIVAHERKLDGNQLKNTIADGRILSGTQAKAERLIDGIGYFEDALAKAKELGHVKNPEVIHYSPPFNLGHYLHLLGEAKSPSFKIQVGPEALKLESGKLYYLSTSLFSDI